MYQPRLIPVTPEQFPDYVQQELQNIARAFVDPADFIQLKVTTVAPKKPRRGMYVHADGTNWNPGSGEGLYRYTGSAWVFVG